MSNTKMINIAKNFQSSVNIAYDLYDENKIKNFIPTTEALDLFEDIFSSINKPIICKSTYAKTIFKILFLFTCWIYFCFKTVIQIIFFIIFFINICHAIPSF